MQNRIAILFILFMFLRIPACAKREYFEGKIIIKGLSCNNPIALKIVVKNENRTIYKNDRVSLKGPKYEIALTRRDRVYLNKHKFYELRIIIYSESYEEEKYAIPLGYGEEIKKKYGRTVSYGREKKIHICFPPKKLKIKLFDGEEEIKYSVITVFSSELYKPGDEIPSTILGAEPRLGETWGFTENAQVQCYFLCEYSDYNDGRVINLEKSKIVREPPNTLRIYLKQPGTEHPLLYIPLKDDPEIFEKIDVQKIYAKFADESLQIKPRKANGNLILDFSPIRQDISGLISIHGFEKKWINLHSHQRTRQKLKLIKKIINIEGVPSEHLENLEVFTPKPSHNIQFIRGFGHEIRLYQVFFPRDVSQAEISIPNYFRKSIELNWDSSEHSISTPLTKIPSTAAINIPWPIYGNAYTIKTENNVLLREGNVIREGNEAKIKIDIGNIVREQADCYGNLPLILDIENFDSVKIGTTGVLKSSPRLNERRIHFRLSGVLPELINYWSIGARDKEWDFYFNDKNFFEKHDDEDRYIHIPGYQPFYLKEIFEDETKIGKERSIQPVPIASNCQLKPECLHGKEYKIKLGEYEVERKIPDDAKIYVSLPELVLNSRKEGKKVSQTSEIFLEVKGFIPSSLGKIANFNNDPQRVCELKEDGLCVSLPNVSLKLLKYWRYGEEDLDWNFKEKSERIFFKKEEKNTISGKYLHIPGYKPQKLTISETQWETGNISFGLIPIEATLSLPTTARSKGYKIISNGQVLIEQDNLYQEKIHISLPALFNNDKKISRLSEIHLVVDDFDSYSLGKAEELKDQDCQLEAKGIQIQLPDVDKDLLGYWSYGPNDQEWDFTRKKERIFIERQHKNTVESNYLHVPGYAPISLAKLKEIDWKAQVETLSASPITKRLDIKGLIAHENQYNIKLGDTNLNSGSFDRKQLVLSIPDILKSIDDKSRIKQKLNLVVYDYETYELGNAEDLSHSLSSQEIALIPETLEINLQDIEDPDHTFLDAAIQQQPEIISQNPLRISLPQLRAKPVEVHLKGFSPVTLTAPPLGDPIEAKIVKLTPVYQLVFARRVIDKKIFLMRDNQALEIEPLIQTNDKVSFRLEEDFRNYENVIVRVKGFKPKPISLSSRLNRLNVELEPLTKEKFIVVLDCVPFFHSPVVLIDHTREVVYKSVVQGLSMGDQEGIKLYTNKMLLDRPLEVLKKRIMPSKDRIISFSYYYKLLQKLLKEEQETNPHNNALVNIILFTSGTDREEDWVGNSVVPPGSVVNIFVCTINTDPMNQPQVSKMHTNFQRLGVRAYTHISPTHILADWRKPEVKDKMVQQGSEFVEEIKAISKKDLE